MSRERTSLLEAIEVGENRIAVSMPDGTLTYRQLRNAVSLLAGELRSEQPLALWATPELATVIGLCAALASGTSVVPLNPKSGEREVEHVLNDAGLSTLIASPHAALPPLLSSMRRIDVDVALADNQSAPWPDDVPARASTLIMYTSGTTGPPKGVVLSSSAIQANLEAIASVWGWSEEDHLVHALPLFHVHGLVLGVLGPLFIGARVSHLGSFSVDGVTEALVAGGSMLFAVPTMYHRVANALDDDPVLASALAGARLLVSGSGPLMKSDYEKIVRASGQHVIERYGMTETLFITSAVPGAPPRPGYVGHALPSVEIRVVDESLVDVPSDDATVGAVLVRSPSLFDGYLNQPGVTEEAMSDGWFSTGDLGVLASDGALRLVGRHSTDLIKSGGYRIGTGEIEQVLFEHSGVEDVAVTGVPDADLGERIVAWIVAGEGATLDAQELIDFVALNLTPHKRPREIRFVTQLPRNAMGKIQKHLLTSETTFTRT
ncbi:MAG TPA: AMP-binding protein [Acidimicrobiales bacterium]